MATYKLIQDIEAEDHIIGPLTLRQFIYALVTAFCLYMCFLGLKNHIWPLTIIFLPVALFAGFFAFPFGKDQSTEIWALAKLRFLFKPRKRIWDQSGVKELVTVTVPKKIEKMYTDGLSQTEVRSRLHALADTIDSRGWAIKNVNINMYGQPSLIAATSDRLIDIGNLPQAVPDYDVQASDDMLDENNNPVAQQFSQMIGASTQAHRQQLVDRLNDVRGPTAQPPAGVPADYWFLNQATTPQRVAANSATFTKPQMVLPGTDDAASTPDATPEEAALVEHMKQQEDKQSVSYSHLRTIQPLGAASEEPEVKSEDSSQPPALDSTLTGATSPVDPAILELASNNDLNVATLARQAHKAKNPDEPTDGEVVISLH